VRLLEDILDRIRPSFINGGKLAFFYPLFEAMETFALTPSTVTTGKTHIRDYLDTKRLMFTVIISLLPCLFFALYNTGFQRLHALGMDASLPIALGYGLLAFLPLFIVTVVVGLSWELLFCMIRKEDVNEGFFVTMFLFPLTLPPTLPLWQAAVAISFGVVIGKEVFGGTGMNIFNPALVARAFLFFSYPGDISGEDIWRFLDISRDRVIDGLTGATPLGVAAAVERGKSVVEALNVEGYSFEALFFGTVPGSMGETSALACLIGAVILIYTKIGSWRTMAGCVTGAFLVGILLNILGGEGSNPMFFIPPHYHLVLGGFAFGTVFMATDPVSSAATSTGKWIYGLFIGAFAITFRVINPAYPEGMMLAILLMNAFAPLIDNFIEESNIKRRLSRGKR
jgi:Na+-transporting NADH:ubiquinone oxidoreductase subunit B